MLSSPPVVSATSASLSFDQVKVGTRIFYRSASIIDTGRKVNNPGYNFVGQHGSRTINDDELVLVLDD